MRREGWDTFPDKAGESTLMSRSGGEKRLRLSGAGDYVFLSSEAAMLGDFLGASRVSSTVSNFKRECGISLETLQKERASSRDDGRTSWFFSSYGGILELRRGWGSLVGFSELQRDVWCFSRVTMGNSGSLLCGPREVQSPFKLRGGARHCC